MRFQERIILITQQLQFIALESTVTLDTHGRTAFSFSNRFSFTFFLDSLPTNRNRVS